MQRIIAALALSGASAFVAPVAKTSAVARASDATETAAPAKTGFTYADLKVRFAASFPLFYYAVDARRNYHRETKTNAQALAKEQNPIVGYFDPLELGDKDFWEQGNEATIGFLREAEIKHGRVAMAGFVGYLVHAKGITWGFPMTMQGDKWPELGDGGVAALWDNLKAGGKWQIIGFVGCLEFWRELQTYETAGKRDAHYMRGGLPGKYPDFEGPLPNLYWGLGAGKKTPEQLAKGRNAEINNGRLAMLGLFGFFAESKAPGSVPFLTQFDFPAYGGDFMQPFEGNFELFGGN